MLTFFFSKTIMFILVSNRGQVDIHINVMDKAKNTKGMYQCVFIP